MIYGLRTYIFNCSTTLAMQNNDFAENAEKILGIYKRMYGYEPVTLDSIMFWCKMKDVKDQDISQLEAMWYGWTNEREITVLSDQKTVTLDFIIYLLDTYGSR